MKRLTIGLTVPGERSGPRQFNIEAELSGRGWEVSAEDHLGRAVAPTRIVPDRTEMRRAVRDAVDGLLAAYFGGGSVRIG